jgi:2Fe-2S ferredoxin
VSDRVVHVEGSDLDLVAEEGETIIEAAWRLGYYWPTVCWGQARCTACYVKVTQGAENLGPIPPDEEDALDTWLPRSARAGPGEVRLACRARVLGEVTVQKQGVQPS